MDGGVKTKVILEGCSSRNGIRNVMSVRAFPPSALTFQKTKRGAPTYMGHPPSCPSPHLLSNLRVRADSGPLPKNTHPTRIHFLRSLPKESPPWCIFRISVLIVHQRTCQTLLCG